MTDQMPKVVPFGKYKGQPIEVLAADRGYLDWLAGQDWFRQRYATLYQTVIVNNLAAPAETPEHNALQVLFLEDPFCAAFVDVIRPGWRNPAALAEIGRKMRETSIAVVRNTIPALTSKIEKPEKDRGYGWKDYLPKWQQEKLELEALLKEYEKLDAIPYQCSFTRGFEMRGVDVILRYELHSTIMVAEKEKWAENGAHIHLDQLIRDTINIEIKPSVGDDYPAVLRQMKANDSRYLFVNSYNGTGATRDQLVKTFAASELRIVFRNEVKA